MEYFGSLGNSLENFVCWLLGICMYVYVYTYVFIYISYNVSINTSSMRIHFKAQQIVFISFAHSCVHNIYNMYRIYTYIYIVYLYIYACLPKYVAYKACIYDTSHLFICTAMFHFFLVTEKMLPAFC